MKRSGLGLIAAVTAVLLALGLWLWPGWPAIFGLAPDAQTIASSSLEGLKRQNRLTVFSARYVAVVTSSETRFGFAAQKTLIVPGTVRYDIDLAQLDSGDLDWNAETGTLTVDAPKIMPGAPALDLTAMREFKDGEIIMALTQAEERLDTANRDGAVRQIAEQAKESLPMQLARDAATQAIVQNFALPLQAAGIAAKVVVRFSS
jgi:hypothetical protein